MVNLATVSSDICSCINGSGISKASYTQCTAGCSGEAFAVTHSTIQHLACHECVAV
jgi:hypothetical protein